jgi:hypothetical protein
VPRRSDLAVVYPFSSATNFSGCHFRFQSFIRSGISLQPTTSDFKILLRKLDSSTCHRYKAGPGPRFDALVKELTKNRIKVQTREHPRVRIIIVSLQFRFLLPS